MATARDDRADHTHRDSVIVEQLVPQQRIRSVWSKKRPIHKEVLIGYRQCGAHAQDKG